MTALPDTLDAARVVTPASLYDQAYMASVDAQILALGGEIVTQRGLSFSWCRPVADPDGATLARGVAVAIKAGAASLMMQPATAANLAAGAIMLGVLTETTPAGSRGRVAVAGAVPASVTGLAAPGSTMIARANATTAMPEAWLSGGAAAIGIIASDGTLVLDASVRAAALTSCSATIATVDVTLTAQQSTVDEIVLGGSPAASHTVTIDAAATRPLGTPLKVRNLTGHDQYFADRNGSVWIIAPASTLVLEWITGANPTLNPVSVQMVGGVLLDTGSVPTADSVLFGDKFGNGGWRDAVPIAWTWLKQPMTDADQTPGSPNNRAAVFYCSGAITADRKLILPLVRRVLIVINATTGAHNVNVIGATGTGALCTPGGAGGPSIVFCDGVNFTLTP